MLTKKKVLVTGGAGYIGSHTVIQLFNDGYDPIIIDNLCNSSQKNIKGINKILGINLRWYNVDCTKHKEIRNIFKTEDDILGCIHFAAFKSVEESFKDPQKYFYNNVKSLEILLKCMKEFNVENIIFSSSCVVYGLPDILPVTEYAPFKSPESPYAETKQICEKILKESKFSSICLRYFNPIGVHVSNLIGDCSVDKPSNLVPIVAEVSMGVRKSLVINGNDYSTHDGTCVRDYIHVMDLADAHVNAFNYLLKKDNLQSVFNVGTGIGYSVLDIVNSFEEANNVKIKYIIGPRRKGDIEMIFSDGKKINKKLDWFPKRTLKEALKSEYKWKKENI